MIDNEIQTNLDKIRHLFKKHHVKTAYLFGSGVRNKLNNQSDIDLLIRLDNSLDPLEAGSNLWELEESLQDLLKRDVDLLTERSLKNPYFIQEIDNTKVKIYG
jgi:predicted nucleotidyltransferase